MLKNLLDDTKEEIILLPTNDFIFKKIFGKEGNEQITKKLLSSILEDKIENIELSKEKSTDIDVTSDKLGILDIEVKLGNGTKVDIEMQVAKQRDIEKRLLFYWSKLYSGNIKAGEEYQKLKRVVIIMFAEFNLDRLKNIPKYHTEWKLKEKDYVNELLTNDIEIDIIEMKKLKEFSKNKKYIQNKELENWIKFLTNPDELGADVMEDVKEIKMAKEELDKIRQDEHDRRVAELRDKYIRDQKAIEGYGYDKGLEAGEKIGEEIGRKRGLAEGEKNGKIKGIAEGKIEKSLEIAKNMIKSNIDIETIIKCTGLTKEEIEKLHSKI